MAPPALSKNYLILGLSGVTSGGKSTLAGRLAAYFSPAVEILCLDKYFLPDKSRLEYLPEIDHLNYESTKAIDWERYIGHVMRVVDRYSSTPSPSSSPLLLILDGFLLFNHARLLSLCHLRYHFHLPYEVAKRRREERFFLHPDKEGYFDLAVWPAYLKHRDEIEGLKREEGIISVDGTEETERVFGKVVADVEEKFRDMKRESLTA